MAWGMIVIGVWGERLRKRDEAPNVQTGSQKGAGSARVDVAGDDVACRVVRTHDDKLRARWHDR